MELHGSEPRSFHFSQMRPVENGERDHQLGDPTLRRLARLMARGGGSLLEDSDVPAGYTYLGQFVAHDMSFDVTAVTDPAGVNAGVLRRGRSPNLDLDSLYGAGPGDPRSARFYRDDRIRFLTGRTVADPRYVAMPDFDLPRGEGRGPRARRKAIIADDRNDENLAVAQTHLAFLRFHNRVAADLRGAVPDDKRFDRARARVTRHYQWMIWHDYLPRVCDADVLKDVRRHGRKVFEPNLGRDVPPTMPREFSSAAFRLGHSMIRDKYDWATRPASLEDLFVYSGRGGDLRDHAALPSFMVADFRRLFDFRGAGKRKHVCPLNVAKRIDTRLVSGLAGLPPGALGGREPPEPRLLGNLAFLNLLKARQVNLATGQRMARFMRAQGVPVTDLGEEEILVGDGGGADLSYLPDAAKRDVIARTPLWFYVLREAELNDGRLHGVGARIVAETVDRAIRASSISYLDDPEWRPTLGRAPGDFDMVDLLLVAYDDDLALPLLELPPCRPPARAVR